MIRITRCAEPAILSAVRSARLVGLRALGRDPSSKEIDGYKIVAEELWRAQHHKCCYCEHRIPRGFNDVEHYRPKAAADRRPGSAEIHGYWWLAFTWENLLFACPACNRSSKNSRFPLASGSSPLMAEQSPPAQESPLLLDPGSTINPVEHIEFFYQTLGSTSNQRHWWARPRNGSQLGNMTIDVCDLNRAELRELREDHYTDVIIPHMLAIILAIRSANIQNLRREFYRAIDLLKPRNAYVGITYDALRTNIPDNDIKNLIGVGWPSPDAIA